MLLDCRGLETLALSFHNALAGVTLAHNAGLLRCARGKNRP